MRSLNSIRHLEHHTGILIGVPTANDIRNIPVIASRGKAYRIILNCFVIGRLITPSNILRIPLLIHLVDFYNCGLTGVGRLRQSNSRINHHICRCQLRQINILHEEPHDAGIIVTALNRTVIICFSESLRYSTVLHIAVVAIGRNDRI